MSKRALEGGEQSTAPKKRSLASWLAVPPPKAPIPLVSSPPLTDRQSTFVAHATTASSSHAAEQFHAFVRQLRSPSHPSAADHEMLAWRTMGLRIGREGVDEADWIVKSGSDDDGEKNGGNTMRKCLEEEGAVDAVVVVSRYYGGVMLGPDRFVHIRTVVKQALALLSASLLVTRLQELDGEIDELLLSRSLGSPGKLSLPPTQSYAGMTVEKCERLVKAREKRRDFLKAEEEKRVQEMKELEKPKLVEAEEKDRSGGDEGQGAEATRASGEVAPGAGEEDHTGLG